MDSIAKLAIDYQKLLGFLLFYTFILDEEAKKGEAEVKIKNTGKKDPKRHLGMKVDDLMHNNIGSILSRMIATKTF